MGSECNTKGHGDSETSKSWHTITKENQQRDESYLRNRRSIKDEGSGIGGVALWLGGLGKATRDVSYSGA